MLANTVQADCSGRALQYVVSWAVGHQDRFYGRHHRKTPHSCAGHWALDNWEFLGFLPHELQKVLEAGQFEHEATVRTWAQKGWLVTSPKRRDKKVHLGTTKGWVIALSKAAIEAEYGDLGGSPANLGTPRNQRKSSPAKWLKS